MTIDDKIRDEKQQFDINKERATLSPLSSGKVDKYEYLAGGEILPSDKRRMIEQCRFTYSPLGNTSEKQTKTIEVKAEKRTKAIQDGAKKTNPKHTSKFKISQQFIFKDILAAEATD